MMQRKKRHRGYLTVRPPAPEKELGLRRWELENPFDYIAELRDRNEGLREANLALREEVERVEEEVLRLRHQQLLDYLKGYGVVSKLHSQKDLPLQEWEGAKVLAIPEGWYWEHDIIPCMWSGPIRREHYSSLALHAPGGRVLGQTTSFIGDGHPVMPFRRREMLLASRRILKELLPEPHTEQEFPAGGLQGEVQL